MFFFSSRRRHTRCALATGVQTCALPISCGSGEAGEICIDETFQPNFTYHKDAEKRRALEVDGVLGTGDVGYFDADGFLYICDRLSDMVISGGVNIYPAEIEAALITLPGVADCENGRAHV